MAAEETKPKEAAKADGDKPVDAEEKKGKKDGKKKEEVELSEEDQKLKDELAMLAERAGDTDAGVQQAALQTIATHVKDSLGSMTTIPKALKFLNPHYALLQSYQSTAPEANSRQLADVLSVLGMTLGEKGACESLKYRLQGTEGIAEWGHEYIRNLCGEVATKWNEAIEAGEETVFLVPLVTEIVTYHMSHSAESEAVDLLLEVEKLAEMLPAHIDDQNYKRVSIYLLSCANYLPPDEAAAVRRTCADMLRKQEPTQGLRVAMMLNEKQLATEIFEEQTDPWVQKQMALMLGSQQMFLDDDDMDDDLLTLMNNEHVSENFLALARDLDVLEPKLPEDIYKTGSSDPGRAAQVDSARLNLASTLVNGFVNAGFCNDKLMNANTTTTTSQSWLYKNKDHGMLSAVASVGMIMMWDVDNLSNVHRYMESPNEYVQAGALLGCGVVNASVRNDCDPAKALLEAKVADKSDICRSCAMLGLGIAYAGSAREDIIELLLPAVTDPETPLDVAAIASVSLGLVGAASCNADIAETLLECLMTRPEKDLAHPLARMLCLGLGLLYLGKGDAAELSLQACSALDASVADLCVVLVTMCAYAASGDVLQVQKLLEIAGRHPAEKEKPDAAGDDEEKKEEEDPLFSRVVGAAVMGVGVVAMGEEMGSEMACRMTNHLIQFGETAAKRAVPLCLAMLSTSNAENRVEVTESLHKLSHDPDSETSKAAIFALGMVGAGTNNSRIADTLRQLATYYERDTSHVFVVRLAQGLLHTGKGLITLAPFHSDRALLRPTALAALLVTSTAALDFKNILLEKYQYLLFTLSLAMHPRMLVCLDEDMQPVKVNVRVGTAVDTVGQTGKPKAITAFQTHSTPVLIQYSERAELAGDDYEPMTSTLEGFVLVKKKEDEEDGKAE